jgi:hypothetical protein
VILRSRQALFEFEILGGNGRCVAVVQSNFELKIGRRSNHQSIRAPTKEEPLDVARDGTCPREVTKGRQIFVSSHAWAGSTCSCGTSSSIFFCGSNFEGALQTLR